MERLGRGDRLRRRLIKNGRRCGADHRRESAKSRKHRKTNKKFACAMGHEAKRDREIKKRGSTTAEKRNANERRRKRQAGRRCGARKQKRRSSAEARSSAAERQRGKDRRGGKSKRIGEKHAMTQCINMHKRAKTSINVEVLANDKTYVPHETRTQRNSLPCTAKRNRGGKMLKRGRCAAR